MFQTLLGALGAFVGVSVAGAAGRKYFDKDLTDQDLRDFIGACLQILLITSIVIFALILVLRQKLALWLAISESWIVLAVLMSAALVVVKIRLGQWQVRKCAWRYAGMQVSLSLFNMLLSLLLVVLLLKGADGRIEAQVVSTAIFAVLALWLLKRDGLIDWFVWRPEYIQEALKFGIPLIPHIAGIFLLTTVDRFVITMELGIAEAGIYMVAVQLAGAIALIFDAINKAYVPWIYSRLALDNSDEKRRIVLFTYLWFVLILLGAALAFLVLPPLVSIIAGPEYAQAGEFIGWLALGQAFSGMYLMVTSYVFYSKRTGLLSLATILSGILNLLLLFILIRILGLVGASIAFCAAMAIRFILTWWVAQHCHPMPWFDLRLSDLYHAK